MFEPLAGSSIRCSDALSTHTAAAVASPVREEAMAASTIDGTLSSARVVGWSADVVKSFSARATSPLWRASMPNRRMALHSDPTSSTSVAK